jgi:hypothetical protein
MEKIKETGASEWLKKILTARETGVEAAGWRFANSFGD